MTPRAAAARGPAARGRRSLVRELKILTAIIPAAIVILVQAISIFATSRIITTELRKRAVVTADEIVKLLEEPLYKVDDDQAVRIGEALLSSGRISGIELESSATGALLRVAPARAVSAVPSEARVIRRDAMVLGSVRLHFSDAEIQRTRRVLTILTLAVLAGVVSASALSSRFLLRRRIQEPLSAIFRGIEAIGRGEYENAIGLSPYEDVNSFVYLVNDMSAKVLSKSRELLEANAELESRVASRTSELQESLSELRRTQERLVESEKLSALGSLSASLAHELNTPLGAIVSSLGSISYFLENRAARTIGLMFSLDEGRRALVRTLLEQGFRTNASPEEPGLERRARSELLARLESMGIPDPESLAENCADLGLVHSPAELDRLLSDPRGPELIEAAAGPVLVGKMAKVASLAAEKASEVVAALRSYLAPPTKAGFGPVDVAERIETVLTLFQGAAGKSVRIAKDYRPAIAVGSAQMLDRVWMNLIRNAIQAMDYRGELSIAIASADRFVRVEIADTGGGIPDDIAGRIFEPFFTTKKDGRGMGLGLGICKSIVETHGGTITFESRPGRTVFAVTIPEYSPIATAAERQSEDPASDS